MGPFYVILAFAILKNAGDFASACSLLPGGRPKCFPKAVDYEIDNNALREIKYRLDKKSIFAYDTNSIEKEIRLGQYWETIVGTKKDIVECTQYSEVDAYSSKYATPLYDYTRLDGGPAVIGETEVTELFLITKKEVWDCKNEQDSKSVVKFKRVVTELVSRKPLGTIFFFDGIEVTVVPLPHLIDQVRLKMNTSIVREVKYIDSEDKVVRYDGQLKFHKIYYYKDEDSSLFKPVRYDSNQRFDEKEFHREELEGMGKDRNKLFYDLRVEDGIVLEDIHRPSGQIGDSSSEATCRILDDVRLNQAVYMPRWAERKLGPEGYRQRKIEFKSFTTEFVVTKHEIWSCTMQDGKTEFERQVIEYIGMHPVKTIDYFTGNKVWVYNLDSDESEKSSVDSTRKNRKSVGVRAIFYYGLNQVFQRRTYAGKLRFAEKIVEEENPKKKKKLMRLILNLFSKGDKMPEDQYELEFDANNDHVILGQRA